MASRSSGLSAEVPPGLHTFWLLSWASVVIALALGACGGNVRAVKRPVPILTSAQSPTSSVADASEGTASAHPVPDPSLRLSDFTSYETCSGCHPQQAEQWQSSAHAHSMKDPVFRALVVRAEQEELPLGAFCISVPLERGDSVKGGASTRRLRRAGGPRAGGCDLRKLSSSQCRRSARECRTRSRSERADAGNGTRGRGKPLSRDSAVLGIGNAGTVWKLPRRPTRFGSGPRVSLCRMAESPARSDGLVCIDCHMPRELGRAAEGFDLPERPVRRHTFLGLGAVTAAMSRGEPGAEDRRRRCERCWRSPCPFGWKATSSSRLPGPGFT